ncbi:MAG: choice-of-anchor Q domain-containing protein [Dokdonella sp.]|uniref:choice-of-anchor Q domain-containing protein n=1 Tax=Dokdonella sp. TaxID=2291710 RepID=UPI003265A137
MRNVLKWFGGAAVVLVLTALSIRPAAAIVVGPGNCNESGLSSALAAVDTPSGGTITFNCGTATINFTSGKQIANTVTIDGGGTITFDGGNAHGFFQFFFSSHVTLKGLTFQHGILSNGVRALENIGALRLDHVKVINNNSTRGPVLNSGTLDVVWSTFSGNSATSGTDGDGGAIENNGGSLSVLASTFNGNTAAHQGGAIFSNSDFSITNSTFNNNTGTGGGGAIYQEQGGNSILSFSTVVGNHSPVFGAGVYNDGGGSSQGTLTIFSSIVSGNETGNCDGLLQTGGYNLSNGTGCGGVFTGTGDLINQNLVMGALTNNGGPTQTMLPAAGNPAINHVPSGVCQLQYDQRGGGRPTGAACDSGAVEVGATIDLIFADGFE